MCAETKILGFGPLQNILSTFAGLGHMLVPMYHLYLNFLLGLGQNFEASVLFEAYLSLPFEALFLFSC